MQNSKAYIMLVCATLFWAGNFIVGKFAFLTNIPPLSLVFYRWLLVCSTLNKKQSKIIIAGIAVLKRDALMTWV